MSARKRSNRPEAVAAAAPKRAARQERPAPGHIRSLPEAQRVHRRAPPGARRAHWRAPAVLQQEQGSSPVAARGLVQYRAPDAIASRSASSREAQDPARGREPTSEMAARAPFCLGMVATTKINFRGTLLATAADFFGPLIDGSGSAREAAVHRFSPCQMPASAQLEGPSGVVLENVAQIKPFSHRAVLMQSSENQVVP